MLRARLCRRCDRNREKVMELFPPAGTRIRNAGVLALLKYANTADTDGEGLALRSAIR
jgi:hypothetical protein